MLTRMKQRVGAGGGGSAGAGGARGSGSIYGSIAVIPPVGTLLQVTAVNAHGNSESVFIDATSFVGLSPESQKGSASNFEFTPTLGILIGMMNFKLLDSFLMAGLVSFFFFFFFKFLFSLVATLSHSLSWGRLHSECGHSVWILSDSGRLQFGILDGLVENFRDSVAFSEVS